MMTAAFFLSIGVLMLRAIFSGGWHRMRVNLMRISTQRQHGEKDGKKADAQKTHGRDE